MDAVSSLAKADKLPSLALASQVTIRHTLSKNQGKRGKVKGKNGAFPLPRLLQEV
jgi:hypothetical protein